MSNGRNILVVDDDPGTRRLLDFVLAKTRHHIIGTVSGERALAEAQAQPIDLLITDLMMGGMDGYQLANALHQLPQYQKLPVILLSARWQVEYKTAAPPSDLIVLLPKPFSPLELLAQVHRMLE